MDQPPWNTEGPEPLGDEPFPRFEPGGARGTSRLRGGSPGGPTRVNPWLVGLAVAVVLVAVSIIAFGLLKPNEGTAVSTSTTAPAGDGSSTTATTDGGSSTTGGDGSTTTGGEGTVTSTTFPDGSTPPITPVGEALPIAELVMTTNEIGPLELGGDGDEVLGRMVATFGEPTEDTGFMVGDGSFGECVGDPVRVVRWGPLNIVVVGQPGNTIFASYRLDLRYGGITSPTTDIETRSGLRVGDTVGQLKDIYSHFAIEFVVDADAGLVFELREQLGSDLLLWGPVESSDDEALVTGIYSPDSCGRF